MASYATGSDETLVNSYTASSQSFPTIATLADGGWVVTWFGYGSGDSDLGIFQQRYAADGDTVGSETLVNSHTANNQYVPSTTALSDGGWVVTWEGSETGNDGGIFQQRYAADGGTVGSETLVNSFTMSFQSSPTTTALSDGGWVVNWYGSGTGDSNGVFQQRYAANGDTVGSETLVNSYTTNSQFNSTTMALSDGGWVVTWAGEGPGDGLGIFQQRYAADGNTVGSETLVNSYTANDQFAPKTTALADGGWLVTWYGEGTGDSWGIFQQRYAADGDAVGPQTLVNSYTTNGQINPTTTALADGGWVVTWQGEGPGDDYGIFQQRYAADGDAVGGETLVNSYTTNDQFHPTTTALADGGWVVTWYGEGPGDTDWGIFQRHFAVDIDGSNHADKLSGTGWGEYLIGYGGNDRLDGKGGADTLTGGKGSDKLYGGADADNFIFEAGDGKDTIKDFDANGSAHDVIDLSHVSGLTDFADLKAHHMQQVGSSVVIDYTANDSIKLEGVKIEELVEADFQL